MADVSLREYVEAILAEKGNAARVADDEREKSASALRDSLARAIAEGDERLREHIQNQIAQINAALTSSEALEVARVSALKSEFDARMTAMDRATDLQLAARDEAIDKADKAGEKRFDAVNEFRGQLADQQHTLVTRELFDAKNDGLAARIATLEQNQSSTSGQIAGTRSAVAAMVTAAVVIISIVSFVANYITTH